MWDNLKGCNTGASKGEERQVETEKIMSKFSPNVIKTVNPHIQGAQRTSKHIINKLHKTRDTILKAVREKKTS